MRRTRVAFGLFLAASASYFVGKCAFKFFKRDVGTRVSLRPATELPFPDVTVCSRIPYKKTVFKKNNLTLHSLFVFKPPYNGSGIMDLFDQLRYSAVGLMGLGSLFRVRTVRPVNGSYIHDLWSPKDGILRDGVFKLQVTRDYGNCYTMSVPKKLQENGVALILIAFDSYGEDKWEEGEGGWVAYLHHAGQFSRELIPLAEAVPGLTVKIMVKLRVTRKLESGAGNTCLDAMDTAFDACWERAKLATTKQELGCVLPWTAAAVDEASICRPVGLPKFYSRKTMNDLRYATIGSGACPDPCESTTAEPKAETMLEFFGLSKERASYEGGLVLNFGPEAESVEEYLVYDALSMVGEAGGYLGLFLGISFYQVILKGLERKGIARYIVPRKRSKQAPEAAEEKAETS